MKTNRLQSFGTFRAISEDGSRVTAVISTGDIARDDAIIDPQGWDFTNYRRNPVVLFNHNDYDGMPVARTVEGPTPNGAELVATAEFDMEDPESARLAGKIKRGFINSTSVRWLPKRWEFVKTAGQNGEERTVLVFREQELLEWSFVNIPADPGAVILRSDGESVLTDFLPQQDPDPEPEPAPDDDDLEDLDEEERAARLNELAARYGFVLSAPANPEQHALAGVIERLEAIATARATPLDVDTLIVRSLAKVTGKTEERIRQELSR